MGETGRDQRTFLPAWEWLAAWVHQSDWRPFVYNGVWLSPILTKVGGGGTRRRSVDPGVVVEAGEQRLSAAEGSGLDCPFVAATRINCRIWQLRSKMV